MRVLLDACVLYPTILREMLLGVAAGGLFQPLWSERILEEWARAATRTDAGNGRTARMEIALLKARWPDAMVEATPGAGGDLWLPDPDDIHVLRAAIAGRAEELLTRNLKDFPARLLADKNIVRRDPDGFLLELAHSHMHQVLATARDIQKNAERISGQPQKLRSLLKRTGLPRLGKLLEQQIGVSSAR
jgi:predicted nucleic acid-binding protein